jgi:hypothetical protein
MNGISNIAKNEIMAIKSGSPTLFPKKMRAHGTRESHRNDFVCGTVFKISSFVTLLFR